VRWRLAEQTGGARHSRRTPDSLAGHIKPGQAGALGAWPDRCGVDHPVRVVPAGARWPGPAAPSAHLLGALADGGNDPSSPTRRRHQRTRPTPQRAGRSRPSSQATGIRHLTGHPRRPPPPAGPATASNTTAMNQPVAGSGAASPAPLALSLSATAGDRLATAAPAPAGERGSATGLLAPHTRATDHQEPPECSRRSSRAEVAGGVIQACTSAGALESMYCTKDFSVDGASDEVSVHLVEILRTITRMALRPADLGPAH
jgi:hypothetical protein